MSTDPPEIDLDENDDGPTPQELTVTVAVTNPLPDPIDVTVEIDNPLFRDRPVDDVDYLPFVYGELDAGGNPPAPAPVDDVDLGTLLSGETKTFKMTGVALDDGTVDLEVLALGVGTSDPNIRVRGLGNYLLEIRTDVLFFFRAEVDNSTVGPGPGGAAGDWVVGSAGWRVIGTMENRSADKTLEVTLIPRLERNAGLGVPIPDGSVLLDPECAVGMVRILRPGEEIDFVAPVRTLGSGATRSMVTYRPSVSIIEDDDTRTPMTDDEKLIADGSEEFLVRVDIREPVPVAPGAGDIVWRFSKVFIETIAELVKSVVALFWALSPINPDNLGRAVVAGMQKYAEYVVTTYANLSSEDRGAFELFFAQTLVSDLNMTVREADTFVRESWRRWHEDMAAEVAAGDQLAIVDRIARLLGENADTIAVPILGGLCKLGREVRLSRTALEINDARIADELAALGTRVDVTNIPTGSFLTRGLRRSLWGIDDAMDARVQAFVDEWGIVIGVRRRGPGSIAKIEAGTHYGKIFDVKAKNISDIDSRYLGFPDDLDTAMISKPPAKEDLLADIAGLSEEEQAKIISRYYTRMDEWYGKPRVRSNPDGPRDFSTSERFKYQQWGARGTAPAPFEGAPLNFVDNVRNGRSLAPDGNGGGFTREVPFDPIITRDAAGNPTSYTPRVDQGRGMKPFTGDIDPIVVASPDFSTLTEAQRIRFYQEGRALGFEHAESSTWNNAAGRASYIADHSYYVEGSEALYTWIPKSQPRATRLDPRMSAFQGQNPADAIHLYIRGSQVSWLSPEPNTVDFDQHEFDDPASVMSPRTVFLIDSECANAGPAGGLSLQAAGACTLPFDRSDDAIILRGLSLGGYEQWTPEAGWTPFEFPEVVGTTLLPLTVLSGATASGADRAPIVDRAEIGVGAGEGWFEVGDVVVIDPGGPTEEFAAIAGFGSLIFDRPLTFAHTPGTIVAVVEPAAVLAGVEFADVGPGEWFSEAVGWAGGLGITTGLGDARFGPYEDLDRAQLITMVWRAAGSPVVSSGVPFTDVDLDRYYGAALRWAYANGIVMGTSPTTFEPDARATRGHIVAVLWRWSGRPDPVGSNPFSDTAPGRYFTVPATWAEEEDVTTGLPGGRFGPDVGADRATLVTMLHRLLA